MTTFSIKHSHGQTDSGFATYEEACEAVRSVYTHAVIGHDGDISEGGERTLCWTSEELALDDAGARACCSITASHEVADEDA